MVAMRIDKWLWAARFYKTRSLAAQELTRGRVLLNDAISKPARELRTGDRVTLRKTDPPTEVIVLALSPVRGPASVASGLYEETAESLAAREYAREQRRLAPEPAHQRETRGRPTKRERRQLDALKRP